MVSDFEILAQMWSKIAPRKTFLDLFHLLLMDIGHNQQQHSTVHSGGVSRVPCSPAHHFSFTFRSPSTFCGNLLWTLFVDTFSEHFFVYTFCGHFLWKLFVVNFCGQLLWTLFVDTFLGQILLKLFAETFCGHFSFLAFCGQKALFCFCFLALLQILRVSEYQRVLVSVSEC